MLPSPLSPSRARPSSAGRSQRLRPTPMAVMMSSGRKEKKPARSAGTLPRSSRSPFAEPSTPERKLPVEDTLSTIPVWTKLLMSPTTSHSGPPMMVMLPDPDPEPGPPGKGSPGSGLGLGTLPGPVLPVPGAMARPSPGTETGGVSPGDQT